MPARKSGAKKPTTTPGISRIAQPEKRTFGFFVRLMRKGVIYNAFFADRTHGGQKKALDAARRHYHKLVREHGPVVRKTRVKTKRGRKS